MNPAREPLAGDMNAHERVEGLLVDAVVSVSHDRVVDVPLGQLQVAAGSLGRELFGRGPWLSRGRGAGPGERQLDLEDLLGHVGDVVHLVVCDYLTRAGPGAGVAWRR